MLADAKYIAHVCAAVVVVAAMPSDSELSAGDLDLRVISRCRQRKPGPWAGLSRVSREMLWGHGGLNILRNEE